MGIYLNPGNEQFAVSVNSELYVDKTELIKYMNSRIGKDRPLICSSRPRRFGKTMAVTMLAAYYSKGCPVDVQKCAGGNEKRFNSESSEF